MDEQPGMRPVDADSAPDARAEARKRYAAPRLDRYGPVAERTRVATADLLSGVIDSDR
jgi:hypothetical protein